MNRSLLEQFTIALLLVAGLSFASCSETVAPSSSIVESASATAEPAVSHGVGFLSDYSGLRHAESVTNYWARKLADRYVELKSGQSAS